MIIWRGWGILAFIYTLVGLAIGAAIGNAASTDNDSTLMFMGLGGIVGAAGGFAHGWYLNVISPRKKAEAWEAAERPRLQQVAQSGQLVYRNTQPTSAAEADADDRVDHRRRSRSVQARRLPLGLLGAHAVDLDRVRADLRGHSLPRLLIRAVQLQSATIPRATALNDAVSSAAGSRCSVISSPPASVTVTS